MSGASSGRHLSSHGRARGHDRRRSRPPTPLKAKIIGGVVTAALAFATIHISLAMSHGDDENDLTAADYASTSQAAATIAAEQRLNDGDAIGAGTLAGQALAVSPISAPALRVLGMSEQQKNNFAHAGALMSQGAALGWRDVPTQLWLAAASIQAKDYAAAANRIDASLRTNPADRDLYNLADQSVVEPGLTPPLIGRLALNPVWRDPYFTDLAPVAPAAAHARAVLLAGLLHSAVPPARDELVATVKRLAVNGLGQEARNLWFSTNRVPQTPLYDGNFEHVQVAQASIFEWLLHSMPGSTIEAVPHPNTPGLALHVTSDGLSTGTIAQQATTLAPGAHRFTVATDGAPAALAAFGWQIRCPLKGPMVLTLPGPAAAAGANFIVPGDCPQQIIELHAQPIGSPRQSEAWFSRATLH